MEECKENFVCFQSIVNQRSVHLTRFIFRLTRASQVYSFPIYLSEEINHAAIFYGTVVPVAVFWVVKMLIVNPFLKMEKEM